MQLGAHEISSDVPLLSVDDLAEQVVEVLDFFGYASLLLLPAFLYYSHGN